MINGIRSACREYADLTAVGTIADVMPVVDENRLIVSMGLREMEHPVHPGLRALFEAADGGDKTAKSILRRNMWEVAKLLTSAAKTFPEKQPLPVVLAGGLTAQPRLVPMIRELLPNNSRFDIKILASEPVEGAVKLAMNLYSETHA